MGDEVLSPDEVLSGDVLVVAEPCRDVQVVTIRVEFDMIGREMLELVDQDERLLDRGPILEASSVLEDFGDLPCYHLLRAVDYAGE